MNFIQDTFESIHRRKKLAAWLATLKGPAKAPTVSFHEALRNAIIMQANLQNTYNTQTAAPCGDGLLQFMGRIA